MVTGPGSLWFLQIHPAGDPRPQLRPEEFAGRGRGGLAAQRPPGNSQTGERAPVKFPVTSLDSTEHQSRKNTLGFLLGPFLRVKPSDRCCWTWSSQGCRTSGLLWTETQERPNRTNVRRLTSEGEIMKADHVHEWKYSTLLDLMCFDALNQWFPTCCPLLTIHTCGVPQGSVLGHCNAPYRIYFHSMQTTPLYQNRTITLYWLHYYYVIFEIQIKHFQKTFHLQNISKLHLLHLLLQIF